MLLINTYPASESSKRRVSKKANKRVCESSRWLTDAILSTRQSRRHLYAAVNTLNKRKQQKSVFKLKKNKGNSVSSPK